MKQYLTSLRRTLGVGIAISLLLSFCVPAVLATETDGETSADGGNTVVEEKAEAVPETEPSEEPTAEPEETAEPSEEPTAEPEETAEPSEEPTAEPEETAEPSEEPAAEPEETAEPSEESAAEPETSAEPAAEVTAEPETVDEFVPEAAAMTAGLYAAESDGLTADTAGKITVDGSAKDWDASEIASFACTAYTSPKVNSWRVARDTDGTVYLCFEGEANSYQDGQWLGVSITQNSRTVTESKGSLQWTCPEGASAEYAYQCDANGNDLAPFVMELSIPGEYFTDPDFMIGLGDINIPASSIPVLDGVEVKNEDKPAVYEGIVIDGKFDDWEAVSKYPAGCPNESHKDCVDQAAMVFDGDWIYCYIHETMPGGGSGAGINSNGGWSIVTDLGNELSFELTADGDIRGIEGAQAKHMGAQWEVAIPASALPYYQESISFGLYYGDVFVENVANLDGSGGNAGEFDGIVIDGAYADWAAYPHTVISYTAPGNVNEDSAGALYTDGSTLYGHVFTTLQAHLQAQGGEFLAAISIAFNGDKEYKATPDDGNFYPRILDIDENGNITTLNEGTCLDEGVHTFYIFDTRTDPFYQFGHTDENGVWHDATAQDLKQNAFGTMKVTVNGYRDEAEFDLDLGKVANYIGADKTDLKEIEVQFGRLGQDWLYIAGTSTGPWLGVALCLGVAGVGWADLSKKKKRKTADK